MINLTRKNKEKTNFLLNHRLIERIEGVHDTIILLSGGKRYIVNESPSDIEDKIIEFESKITIKIQNKKDVGEL